MTAFMDLLKPATKELTPLTYNDSAEDNSFCQPCNDDDTVSTCQSESSNDDSECSSVNLEEANIDILEQHVNHHESGHRHVVPDMQLHKTNVELLHILKKAKAPLNLFGEIQQ